MSIYLLTFSTHRLRSLLGAAGMALYITPDMEDAVVRFVSDCGKGTVALEIRKKGEDWQAASSVPTEEETVKPTGMYL